MKKVLIISYYWPPSGGSGVQRWLKFSKYLPKYGWQPIVCTPENPYSELFDLELSKDLPDNIKIWKFPIWEPYIIKDKIFGKNSTQTSGVISNKNSVLNRFFKWIRGNFFVPDPKVLWVKPTVKKLYQRIQSNNIEHIVTTGPPHSMHLIGLGLKKKMPNLKWIADFRDPWSKLDLLDEFSLLESSRRMHARLERDVIKNANITLTVSERWYEDFKVLGASRTEIITNGFDKDDFNIQDKSTKKFIIGHYGLINHLRNPKLFWKILDKLCGKYNDFNNQLEIHLAGNIDEDIINEIKSYSSLNDKIINLGYLSHKEVLNHYSYVSLFLLLIFNSDSGKGNYPGKMFEYFGARKPILAFGPVGSDAENLFKDLNLKTYFNYNHLDEALLADIIMDVFNNKRSNLISSDRLDCFSREMLTQQLSNLLNTLN